ncbi:tRNA (adenine(58)-N(1))-methyltransferase [Heracleum sosnowskyi]|uniref:tRNA (adenine(58)-N(1))-methyltransferase n=1 Tax=Heracleum sosnowskyi TaxID=360622 RepID=A0AAD8M3V6_9APIA|nr:tRNA (adenine(58)-N(1))-methyltransferase [Heracleum sosnowskyi]
MGPGSRGCKAGFLTYDWIGKPFGSKVFSNKGGFVYLLAPTPELWTLVLSHRTQILYIADISFVIMYLEIVPDCLVLESGTGSGSLTTSLARAVAPSILSSKAYDGEGFPNEFTGKADYVFLDLPQPWLAIPSVGKMLKQDGILSRCSVHVKLLDQILRI